jgi:hypothetical protein
MYIVFTGCSFLCFNRCPWKTDRMYGPVTSYGEYYQHALSTKWLISVDWTSRCFVLRTVALKHTSGSWQWRELRNGHNASENGLDPIRKLTTVLPTCGWQQLQVSECAIIGILDDGRRPEGQLARRNISPSGSVANDFCEAVPCRRIFVFASASWHPGCLTVRFFELVRWSLVQRGG